MVEYQPSKLAAWVRFPSPAPIFSERGVVDIFREVNYSVGNGRVR